MRITWLCNDRHVPRDVPYCPSKMPTFGLGFATHFDEI